MAGVAALEHGIQARASALLSAANTPSCVSAGIGDVAVRAPARAGIGLTYVQSHGHKRQLLRRKLEIRIPDKACSI